MEAKLESDYTVRTRHVAVAMEPTLLAKRWSRSKPRMAESATVSFTDTQEGAVHDHGINVTLHGRYVVKGGGLGTQTWNDTYVWRCGDNAELYDSIVAAAQAAL